MAKFGELIKEFRSENEKISSVYLERVTLLSSKRHKGQRRSMYSSVRWEHRPTSCFVKDLLAPANPKAYSTLVDLFKQLTGW